LAVGGVVLKRAVHQPMRTCVGCRAVDAQRALVRVAWVSSRLVMGRHAPGRGVYLHARPGCIEAALRGGIARSLRRAMSPEELRRLATNLSPTDDNCSDQRQMPAGLALAEAVETPPRTQAKE